MLNLHVVTSENVKSQTRIEISKHLITKNALLYV